MTASELLLLMRQSIFGRKMVWSPLRLKGPVRLSRKSRVAVIWASESPRARSVSALKLAVLKVVGLKVEMPGKLRFCWS